MSQVTTAAVASGENPNRASSATPHTNTREEDKRLMTVLLGQGSSQSVTRQHATNANSMTLPDAAVRPQNHQRLKTESRRRKRFCRRAHSAKHTKPEPKKNGAALDRLPWITIMLSRALMSTKKSAVR